ncbi:MAG: pseudouridine synthase [Pseudanabaenaceae cyanobacterium bins.68]|nr:pseudouridine synthase [Pseudanabaenaceae cyanobacterium bins.68]
MALERLQKILASHGFSSRRGAEQLILAGRVQVNGQVVTTLGSKADLDLDLVLVDQQPLNPQTLQLIYLLLHKPVGYLCTRADPEQRPKIYDLLPCEYQSVFSVGRLDLYSSGALLLTNDGEFAQLLSHPRHHIAKTYEVWLNGKIDGKDLEQWRSGIMLDQKLTQPAEIKILQATTTATKLQIRLREGRNRQIRRCAEQLGYQVKSIHRQAIGNLVLGDLEKGKFRLLTPGEVDQLHRC